MKASRHESVIWKAVAIAVMFACLPGFCRRTGPEARTGIVEGHEKRLVSVLDAVGMTQFGDTRYLRGFSAKYTAARFSPDGERFVVVTRRGDTQKNVNVYSLLLFKSSRALESPIPEVLVTMASSSTRPGIQEIKWIDNRTLAFMGEDPGEMQQVYEVDSETKVLTKLTDAATNILSYAIDPSDKDLFFLAERAPMRLVGRDSGWIVVSDQALPDLIGGESFVPNSLGVNQFADLFRQRIDYGPERIRGDFVSWGRVFLSPNGQYLIARALLPKIPTLWSEYASLSPGPPFVSQYEIINTQTGEKRPLLDAPAVSSTCSEGDIVWSANAKSVVVAQSYLPLNVPDFRERDRRKSKRMLVEIKIPTLEIMRISESDFCPLGWDSNENLLAESSNIKQDDRGPSELHKLERIEGGWNEVKTPTSPKTQNEQITVTLEEDMNSPPQFFATGAGGKKKSFLMDLNPQFKNLTFGKVEDIAFDATDGRRVHAGLYLPPNYDKQKRYPLVIQTHGWNPERFWITGPYATAFAAQPLASAGIIVLQVELSKETEEMSAYEGGIEYLNRLGIVDLDRIGIIGFSVTGIGAEYTLIRSKYRFAAATLADVSDVGYFFYLSLIPALYWRYPSIESLNGTVPFGDGLRTWLERSPGFNLNKVNTPVRLEANQRASPLGIWEWFAGLSRLGKPVELVYKPDAGHVLVRPWDELASEQGNVDWFRFWLKGEEDPDPAKAEQYTRWRRLRQLQRERDQNGRSPLPN